MVRVTPATKWSLPCRQRESPLWSRGERMRVELPSTWFMARQLIKTSLNNTLGSRMQSRMKHPIPCGGPGRCCHVDIVVIHAITCLDLCLWQYRLEYGIVSPLLITRWRIVCRRMARNACVATRAHSKVRERTCRMTCDATNQPFSLFPKSLLVMERSSSPETRASHVEWRARVRPA